MPAGKTYTPIASTTMTTASPSITFSNISGSYTDLRLICTLQNINANSPYLRFNGDTSSNYSQTYLEGNGSTAVSARGANQTFGYINLNSDPGNNGFIIVDIMNYANTTTFKTYLANASNAGNAVDVVVGTWRSTSAISTILIASSNGGNYAVGSKATLYGILAA
jgi:hypothetical protein